jgi:hypothetical protein
VEIFLGWTTLPSSPANGKGVGCQIPQSAGLSSLKEFAWALDDFGRRVDLAPPFD